LKDEFEVGMEADVEVEFEVVAVHGRVESLFPVSNEYQTGTASTGTGLLRIC
jgi:hypothetical protein